MKIEGPRQTSAVVGARKAGDAAAPGFSLPASAAGPTAPAHAAAATASLDALMALQADVYDPRRKGRQVKRGKAVLEALEALAQAMLMGEAPQGARRTLANLQGEIEPTGDPRLDAVLEEIDLRAAVELAKLDMAELARARRG